MTKLKKQSVLSSKPKLKKTITKRKNAALVPKLKKIDASKLKEAVSKETNKKGALPSEFGKTSIASEFQKEIEAEEIDELPQLNFIKPNRDVDEDQVKRGVNALYEYITKRSAKKTELFDDEQPIFLQVTCVKVPNCPYRQVRFTVPNSLLVNASQDICLIVKDIGKPKEHEETIEHFEKLLREQDVTNIKTIMPFHEFKTEYGNQFELKRKLLGLYDQFLVDGRISGHVVRRLGKIFTDKRKTPIPIRMESLNLKEHIDRSLRKTVMKIHSKGDSFTVQIGHTKMNQEQIYENLIAIIDDLSIEFPGGFENVRFLGIKTDRSLLIPIYLTLKSKSTVPKPTLKPKRPKQFKDIRGELTTYLKREVTVLPSGEIITHDIPDATNSDVESMEDDIEEESLNSDEDLPQDDQQEIDEDQGETEEKATPEMSVEGEEEEEDNVLAQTEAAYLTHYEKEVKLKKKKQNKSKTIQENSNNQDKSNETKIEISPKKSTQKQKLKTPIEVNLKKTEKTRKLKATQNKKPKTSIKSKKIGTVEKKNHKTRNIKKV